MPEEATTVEAPDVNTDEGFNRALAGQLGKELSSEQLDTLKGSDRSVANGLEIPGESTQPKDPETGRFLPKEPIAPTEAPAEGAAPEGATPPADDPFADLITQHGGDVRKALEAVAAERDNAQSAIGRQGEELGRLRALELEKAKLEGQLEAQTASPQAPAPFVPFSQIEAAISESDDPSETAPSVMAWVVENGTDEQINQTLKVWAEYDPVGASDFSARRAYFEEAARAEAARGAQPAAVAADPWVAQQKLNEEIAGSLTEALSTVSAEERTALAPYLSKAWDTAPGYQKQAMTDPANRADVLGQLVQSARAQLVTDSIAAAKAAGGETPAPVHVVSGANVNPLPPEGGSTEERTPEAVSKALQKALLETDTTSVSSGLTYGSGSSQQ